MRHALVVWCALPCALASALVLAARRSGSARAADELRDGFTRSSDGIEIHYREGGRGDTALVFVHGWLGNASWWEDAMRRFAPAHRVVALDLAGHGRSGGDRAAWSVERFADDVACVVRALELERVVLLGHSMSGAITVEAARRLDGRVVLLVPVDTLNDLDWDLPPEAWDQFFGGLRASFPDAVEAFVRERLFVPGSPPAVVARVVGEMRAAETERSVAMLEAGRDYDLRAAVRALAVPIHALNSDLNPTKLDVNRVYAPSFAVELLPGSGHWPMLEQPAAFAAGLARVLAAHAL